MISGLMISRSYFALLAAAFLLFAFSVSLCLVSPVVAFGDSVPPQPPSAKLSSIASLVTDAPVYKKPGDGKAITTARADTSWTGIRTVLLITKSKISADGRLWLKVILPTRPNGSKGWILASHANISTTKARVEISIRARKLRLRLNGKIVMIMRTVVGKRSTPTPKGNFAIYERAPSEKGSNIGPFALHLTAFSNVLRSYDGGPGRIAIHGRSGSLLYDPLGSARSHGCVRISNSPLKRLAKFAKPGTPVSIAFGWPKLPAS